MQSNTSVDEIVLLGKRLTQRKIAEFVSLEYLESSKMRTLNCITISKQQEMYSFAPFLVLWPEHMPISRNCIAKLRLNDCTGKEMERPKEREGERENDTATHSQLLLFINGLEDMEFLKQILPYNNTCGTDQPLFC